MPKDPKDRPPPIPESIRRHRAAQARGCREWEADEIVLVVKLYPDYAALREALPHRSYSSIRYAADKFAARRRRHVWTTVENAKLKRMWANNARTAEIKAGSCPIAWCNCEVIVATLSGRAGSVSRPVWAG